MGHSARGLWHHCFLSIAGPAVGLPTRWTGCVEIPQSPARIHADPSSPPTYRSDAITSFLHRASQFFLISGLAPDLLSSARGLGQVLKTMTFCLQPSQFVAGMQTVIRSRFPPASRFPPMRFAGCGTLVAFTSRSRFAGPSCNAGDPGACTYDATSWSLGPFAARSRFAGPSCHASGRSLVFPGFSAIGYIYDEQSAGFRETIGHE